MTKSNKNKLSKFVAPVLASAIGVAGLTAYNHDINTMEASSHQSIETDARREANRLTAELSGPGKETSARVATWQGVIQHRTAQGTEYIANPIVLSAHDLDSPSPSRSDAAPSYYGFITPDTGSNFAIQVREFTEDDSFAPFAEDGSVRTTDAYISTVEPANTDSYYYQAIGFDASGEQHVTNPDGSLLSPGLILPQDNK